MPDLSWFFFGYIGLALGYNVLSEIWRQLWGQTLAPTDPQRGLQVVTLLYLTFVIARDLAPVSGRLVLLVWAGLVTWSGILRHLQRDDSRTYAGEPARWGAALINLYGVIVILIFVFNHSVFR